MISSSRDQASESRAPFPIGRFASGVAHDFNNMLQVIGSYPEILLMMLRRLIGEDIELVWKPGSLKGSSRDAIAGVGTFTMETAKETLAEGHPGMKCLFVSGYTADAIGPLL